MKPLFTPTDGGLEIVDQIERHRYLLGTPTPVTPVARSPGSLPFAVDAAVEITTNGITSQSVHHTLLAQQPPERPAVFLSRKCSP